MAFCLLLVGQYNRRDNLLLTGSLRDNILLGRDDVDDEEMIRAAKAALAHDFIATMPNGYDVQLADRGEGLSGGQRQAIAMARALVGRPPILVFDEPTSAVDSETEARLMTNLRQEFEGRTLIVITHRPSLLNLVNRVILLSRGRIAMDGTPDSITRNVARIRAR